MHKYRFEGAVKIFDKLVEPYWVAETYAASPAKARSNFTYRYKKLMGLEPYSKVKLDGAITKID